MNILLVIKLLGRVCIALGLAMVFSLPWACVYNTQSSTVKKTLISVLETERDGHSALLLSVGVCFVFGAVLCYIGQKAKPTLFRREALAVVVFSWILATALGALPYYLSGITCENTEFGPVKMTFIDAMFESLSGFSTTGATVISDVESMPRCILFWRCCTHFLGGIGIIVLLVALLGQGLGGKEVLRAERGGSPSEGTPQARVQSLAWSLFGIYIGLNVLLTLVLMCLRLSFFDAICHAFSTMATGGFSTYNASIGHFATDPRYNAAVIEWVLTLFMFLGGTNFVLFFWCLCGEPGRLFRDVEWRTYVGIVLVASILVCAFGLWYGSFGQANASNQLVTAAGSASTNMASSAEKPHVSTPYAMRTACFHVVSLMTTTGFMTEQYKYWSLPAVAILLALMLSGACAGSTTGGLKLFRVVLGFKIIKAHIEQIYRPNVVRNIWLQKNVVNRDLLNGIVIYITLYFALLAALSIVIAIIEPSSTWTNQSLGTDRQLLDIFSMALTSVSNTGAGVGIIGGDGNFGSVSQATKFLITWVMLLGRLEIFVVLAVFSPRFWRSYP